MDQLIAVLIVKFLDPIQFLAALFVVLVGFRDGNKAIILYAAIAATIVNFVAMNILASTVRPIALIMSFPAALLQSYIVFLFRNARYRRSLENADEVTQEADD